MNLINQLGAVQQRVTNLQNRVLSQLPAPPSVSKRAAVVSFAETLASTRHSQVAAGPVYDVPYAELFNEAGARHGIPPAVLASVGWVESRFRPDATSQAGAVGVMQFMPETARQWQVDPTNPASSIDGAARLLRHLVDQFGSLEQGLAAYNVGAGTVQRNGPLGGAEDYVNAVMDRIEHHL